MMENGIQCGSQKRIFRMATNPVFLSIDHVLYILKPKDAYEKCSPDLGDSNEVTIRNKKVVNKILCKEKVNFIKIQK